MNKKYDYFDSKNIKIFLESTFEFGAEFCFKIAISFRTNSSGYDDQFIEISDFAQKKGFFRTREHAEKTAFNIAEKIEKFVSDRILWISAENFTFQDGKMYAVSRMLYKNDIEIVVFDKKTELFTSLKGVGIYNIDLVSDFDFS